VVNRGEVWWVAEPSAGRRPACVLTRQAALPVLSSVTVALVTRTVRGAPSELVLDVEDGMPERCAITLDNLATLPKALFVERITRLGVARLEELCRALRLVTGC
jgi:mRNA interferase MazF